MNCGGAVTTDIRRLLELFRPHCVDHESVDTLLVIIRDPAAWRAGYGLFQAIRKKTLVAERSGDKTTLTQCLFEEICAKTLYNLSGEPAPFDADSPYWVVPNAIAFGRLAGIPESVVLACISLQGE
jgi:hypothetical protein